MGVSLVMENLGVSNNMDETLKKIRLKNRTTIMNTIAIYLGFIAVFIAHCLGAISLEFFWVCYFLHLIASILNFKD